MPNLRGYNTRAAEQVIAPVRETTAFLLTFKTTHFNRLTHQRHTKQEKASFEMPFSIR